MGISKAEISVLASQFRSERIGVIFLAEKIMLCGFAILSILSRSCPVCLYGLSASIAQKSADELFSSRRLIPPAEAQLFGESLEISDYKSIQFIQNKVLTLAARGNTKNEIASYITTRMDRRSNVDGCKELKFNVYFRESNDGVWDFIDVANSLMSNALSIISSIFSWDEELSNSVANHVLNNVMRFYERENPSVADNVSYLMQEEIIYWDGLGDREISRYASTNVRIIDKLVRDGLRLSPRKFDRHADGYCGKGIVRLAV
jgi:hypothetical protein